MSQIIPLLDVEDFRTRIVESYNRGVADAGLPADLSTARSLIPAGTGAFRDFSYIAPEIPLFKPDQCVGCMECVTACPDTAILGKVVEPSSLESLLAAESDPAVREEFLCLIPMGRIADANEIQGLALFLASPASSYLTGQVIAIDGGITAA